MPSKPCLGDEVTLRCEVLVTLNNNESMSRDAAIRRDGELFERNTPNHMLLRNDDFDVIGVVIRNITLNDEVEYTCDTIGAPDDFVSSLTLNVTGIYLQYAYVSICMFYCI